MPSTDCHPVYWLLEIVLKLQNSIFCAFSDDISHNLLVRSILLRLLLVSWVFLSVGYLSDIHLNIDILIKYQYKKSEFVFILSNVVNTFVRRHPRNKYIHSNVKYCKGNNKVIKTRNWVWNLRRNSRKWITCSFISIDKSSGADKNSKHMFGTLIIKDLLNTNNFTAH